MILKENIKAPHLNTLIALYNSKENKMLTKFIMIKEPGETSDHEAEGDILNAKEWMDKYGIIPGTVNGHYFDQIDIQAVGNEMYENLLNHIDRVWDDINKIGISPTHCHTSLLRALREDGFVLIRNDDWSLCCRKQGLPEAYQLYPKSWDSIYTIDNDH